MRHSRARTSLGLTVDHRKALFANMIQALVLRKKIRTTLKKAKVIGKFADKMVTIAKKQTLAARRQLISEIRSQQTAKLFIEVVAPAFKARKGGYTRVLKLENRPGDNAPMAILEFTENYELPGADKKKDKKKKAPKADAKKEDVKKSSKEAKAKDGEGELEVDDEKKGSGFLGNLRGFLKGD